MKRLLAALLLLLLCLSAACARTAAPAQADNVPVTKAPAGETAPAAAGETQAEAEVDVDLTLLSSTMVYSEVYAMVTEPERYIGKSVKMEGQFATAESGGKRYYACIIQDATACCAQGLEFEPAGEIDYPGDFPEEGATITVTGVFDTYTEPYGDSEALYIVLRNADF